MAQPVWVLSVDLQTKNATFISGLGDAAKAARGTFSEIGSGSAAMGGRVGGSMTEARHTVMMLAEEFGGHLPRALATFIASVGPLGGLLSAAFPFMAIVMGATMLIEHLNKLKEEGKELTEEQVKFGTAVNNAFNSLDMKLLQAQQKSAELKNNHLAALRIQLELIDKQSMAELVKAFEEVAKAADAVFAKLQAHWYEQGSGAKGAKNALGDFRSEYEFLLSAGKNGEATGLLSGTLKQAQHVLDLQQKIQSASSLKGQNTDEGWQAEVGKQRAIAELKQLNAGYSEKEVAAQRDLVQALGTQVGIEAKSAQLKKLEGSNATTATGNEEAARKAEGAKALAESQLRMGQMYIAAEKAQAMAELEINNGTIEQKLAIELSYASREQQLLLAANAAQTAALDRSGKDYHNQLQATRSKALEIEAQYDEKIKELSAQSSVAVHQREVQELESAERQKIEATEKGSAERVAAVDAAIHTEQSKNLQNTNFFRELLNSKVDAVRQEAAEEGKLKAEASTQQAQQEESLAMLAFAAQQEHLALVRSATRSSTQRQISDAVSAADQEYSIKAAAFAKEIQALDKHAKDYQNKLQAMQNKEVQMQRQHDNDITSIKDRAEKDRNTRILASEAQFNEAVASGLTQSIMGHQTWSKMLLQLGDQVVSGMIQNAIKSMMAADMTKEKDAASAARKAFNIGMSMGGPAGYVLGPIMAAAAFSEVMAFANGTDKVSGTGHADTVPAMLTPGEGVVPGGVMDGLSTVARNGGFTKTSSPTVHIRPTYNVQTIDGDGMSAALDKHTDLLQQKFAAVLRGMNR